MEIFWIYTKTKTIPIIRMIPRVDPIIIFLFMKRLYHSFVGWALRVVTNHEREGPRGGQNVVPSDLEATAEVQFLGPRILPRGLADPSAGVEPILVSGLVQGGAAALSLSPMMMPRAPARPRVERWLGLSRLVLHVAGVLAFVGSRVLLGNLNPPCGWSTVSKCLRIRNGELFHWELHVTRPATCGSVGMNIRPKNGFCQSA